MRETECIAMTARLLFLLKTFRETRQMFALLIMYEPNRKEEKLTPKKEDRKQKNIALLVKRQKEGRFISVAMEKEKSESDTPR